MKLLALTTSTSRGSAAVFENRGGTSVIAGAVAYADLQGHAERIFEAIDAALAQAGIDRSELTAIACDIGPGSFTGVRVGVASAKGIALALGVPLAGVVSLQAMAAAAFAEGGAGADDVVMAAIDAKKDEVFVAAFALEAGVPRALAPPRHEPRGPLSLALPWEARRVVVVGEIASIFMSSGPGFARGAALDLPDAGYVARLAAARITAGERCSPDAVEPLYVRAPDAKTLAAAAGERERASE